MRVEDRILYRIAQAEHAMRTALERELREHGLSMAGYAMLKVIADVPEISASQISRRVMVTQQAAARVTARLVREKLVLVSPDPKHGRVQRLRLTRIGRLRLLRADEIVEEAERSIRNALDPVELRSLEHAIDRFYVLFATVQEPDEADSADSLGSVRRDSLRD